MRDAIPAKLKGRGVHHKARTLGAAEFFKELVKKVEEEASALPHAKKKEEFIAEIADLEDVIDEIKKTKKIKSAELLAAKKANSAKKGGFKKRIFLLWAEDDGYKTNEKRRK